jgi:hypothetical protein
MFILSIIEPLIVKQNFKYVTSFMIEFVVILNTIWLKGP